jgi:hypothetical protein
MGVVFPAWLWRSALALAALLIAVGGALHPAPVTSLSFEQSTAAMLADPLAGGRPTPCC